jgi:hypothetical protein
LGVRRTRSTHGSRVATAAVASLALHLTLATFIATAALREPDAQQASRLTTQLRPGTPGTGEAFLATPDPQTLAAPREGRRQPSLDHRPAASAVRDQPPSLADALTVPQANLPPAFAAGELGAAISRLDALSAAEQEPLGAPPASASADGAGDDRDSPAVAPEADPRVIDLRSGTLVSGGEFNFKPRFLRGDLPAHVDGYFVSGRVVDVSIVTDSGGTPLRVTITRSTGSDAIDGLVRQSLFVWWFDPDDVAPGVAFPFSVKL